MAEELHIVIRDDDQQPAGSPSPAAPEETGHSFAASTPMPSSPARFSTQGMPTSPLQIRPMVVGGRTTMPVNVVASVPLHIANPTPETGTESTAGPVPAAPAFKIPLEVEVTNWPSPNADLFEALQDIEGKLPSVQEIMRSEEFAPPSPPETETGGPLAGMNPETADLWRQFFAGRGPQTVTPERPVVSPPPETPMPTAAPTLTLPNPLPVDVVRSVPVQISNFPVVPAPAPAPATPAPEIAGAAPPAALRIQPVVFPQPVSVTVTNFPATPAPVSAPELVTPPAPAMPAPAPATPAPETAAPISSSLPLPLPVKVLNKVELVEPVEVVMSALAAIPAVVRKAQLGIRPEPETTNIPTPSPPTPPTPAISGGTLNVRLIESIPLDVSVTNFPAANTTTLSLPDPLPVTFTQIVADRSQRNNQQQPQPPSPTPSPKPLRQRVYENVSKAGKVGATAAGKVGQNIAANKGFAALTEAASGAAETLLTLVPAGGAIAAFTGGLALVGAPLAAFGAAVTMLTEAFVARAEKIKIFSGDIMAASAGANIRQMMADIREAQTMGPDYSRLITAQSELSVMVQDLLTPIKHVVVDLLARFLEWLKDKLNAISIGMEGVKEMFKVIGEAIAQFFSDIRNPSLAKDILDQLQARMEKAMNDALNKPKMVGKLPTISDIMARVIFENPIPMNAPAPQPLPGMP